MSKVVLALSGSLRKPPFTEKMLDLCLAGMGDGIDLHKFYPHKIYWTMHRLLVLMEEDPRKVHPEG